MLGLTSPIGRMLKRTVDVVGAAVGLVVSAPLLVLLSVLVWVDAPGPVFFRQERVGQHGRPFRIWKFRTMVDGAEASGPGVTVARDARITRVGRWLRQTKLDELPQLLNVLGGSMSLVGPRPELPRYVELYSGEERAVLLYRPGITDPATLAFRREEEILAAAEDPERHYREVVMRDKILLNLEYARRATVWSDVEVIVRTLGAVLFAGRA